MLQSLRDKAQGWITWVIIGLICITFALFGAESFFSSTGGNQKVVAVVNGKKITALELDNVYQRFLHQQGSESARYLDPNYVKKELLQTMVDETVILQSAVHLGMRISPARLQNTLVSIPFLQNDGHFSPEAYHQFLTSANFTDLTFKELLRDSLLKQQLQQGILQTTFALPEEAKTLVKYLLQKRDVQYLTIEKAPFEKDLVITPDDSKNYYESHKDNFVTDEQIALEYIHVSMPEILKQYQAKNDELENYYRENIAVFKKPGRVHIEHILIAAPKDANAATLQAAQERLSLVQAKLKAGESFEALAKTYSDDKASAKNGGDLSWLEQGEMIPEFEKAAFSLDKKGQITTPVKTQFGFHLIKLLDKQAEVTQPFDQVKEEVATKVKQQWGQEELTKITDELTENTYDRPESLQPAAEKLNLPITKTELFSIQQAPQGTVLQNPAVMAAALSAPVKEEKNNSDLIKIDDENYIVLRVSQNIPAKQKALAEVEPQIKTLLLTEKSEALAQAAGEKILQAIRQTPAADLPKVETQYSWQKKAALTRTSGDLSADLIQAVFAMPDTTLTNQPVLKVVHLDNGNYAVVWLTKSVDGDFDVLSREEKEKYRLAYAKHMGELEYALYSTKLMAEAKIKKNLN